MTIIAIDPGKVSGLAVYEAGLQDINELSPLETAGRVEWWLQPDSFQGQKHVVIEAFTINQYTAKQSAQNDALEIIGMCRFLAHKYDATFKLQKPAQRKIVTDAALRSLGWYFPTPDKHMVDAAKHLVVACLHLGVMDPETLRPQGEGA